jgi:hypothetical protein
MHPSINMNQIIIFRFHNKLEICKNKLKLLNKLNTNTPIYGIYGGNRKNRTTVLNRNILAYLTKAPQK